MNSQLDSLDQIARRVAKGDKDAAGCLSTGEALYAALAANDIALLNTMGYTIAEALARIGPEWMDELIARWKYKGNPANI